MTDEQWGPWIEHDGKGCPCVGQFVHRIHCRGDVNIGVVMRGGRSWTWAPGYTRVLRYRIRKPRALLDLIERARELDDAPEGPEPSPRQVRWPVFRPLVSPHPSCV
jgi:hypothetical protein